jgi:quercetin dioxygenase-like cupin family protein
MSLERASDHPRFELGGNAITSFAAPARGATEAALYHVEVPPGGGLPAHHHDHLDVFFVQGGGGTFYIDDMSFDLAVGDSVVVPTGTVHRLEAGSDGASIVVTMLAGTTLTRADDHSTIVPPWVS